MPLELAERCEKATGPDRELDADIGDDQPPCRNLNPRDTRGRVLNHVPRYTASLDAAMTLVPEGCSATVWTAGPRGFTTGPAARLFSYPKDPGAEGGYAIRALSDHEITAATPALALCAAALRARSTNPNTERQSL